MRSPLTTWALEQIWSTRWKTRTKILTFFFPKILTRILKILTNILTKILTKILTVCLGFHIYGGVLRDEFLWSIFFDSWKVWTLGFQTPCRTYLYGSWLMFQTIYTAPLGKVPQVVKGKVKISHKWEMIIWCISRSSLNGGGPPGFPNFRDNFLIFSIKTLLTLRTVITAHPHVGLFRAPSYI